MSAPQFRRVMLPRRRVAWLPVPPRGNTPGEIICHARQTLARRYARRSCLSTAVWVWCDTHAGWAGSGEPHPILAERERLARAMDL